MAKNKQRVKEINKSFNEDCPNDKYICPHILKPDDEPTQLAGLGVRCFLAFLGWLVLGFSMEGKTVFNSLFLYFAPLCVDYFRFRPATKWRRILQGAGKTISITLLIVCVLGFIGIIDAVSVDNTVTIKVASDFIAFNSLQLSFKIMWYIIGIAPFLTLLDNFAYTRKADYILVNKACIA